MKKALVTATVASFIALFETNDIGILKNLGYEVHYAANCEIFDNKDKTQKLDSMGVIRHNIPFARNPFDKNNIMAYKMLKKMINEENFDIIHCHTPVGGVLTRIAARKSRKKGTKVIYTAHGFHFYKGAPLKNWLLYYPVEKICSYFTDVLITINKEDYELAQQKMRAKDTVYIPGVGIDLDKFKPIKINSENKRKELGIPNGAVWILAVGELISRKNHETLIRAVANMDNVYLTIAGGGELYDYLKKIIDELNISPKVKLLGFRSDVSELCSAADIFVFPSFQEGLPVALMEAMACGLPVACSRIRGNVDLIDEYKGGVMFDPKSIEDTANALKRLLKSDLQTVGCYNNKKIKNFDLNKVKQKITEIYMEL